MECGRVYGAGSPVFRAHLRYGAALDGFGLSSGGTGDAGGEGALWGDGAGWATTGTVSHQAAAGAFAAPSISHYGDGRCGAATGATGDPAARADQSQYREAV
jgi:hypothetical protein